MPELPNVRHERFAQAKAVGKNHWEAVLYAGYDSECLRDWDRKSAPSKEQKDQLAKNAHRLYSNGLIRARIHEIQHQTSVNAIEAVSVRKEFVLQANREILDRAMENVPVRAPRPKRDGSREHKTELHPCTKCGEQRPVGVYQCDLRTAVRAVELFGRYTGLESAGKHLEDGTRDPFSHMSEEEIVDYLVAIIRELGGSRRVIEELGGDLALGQDALPAEASQPERPH